MLLGKPVDSEQLVREMRGETGPFAVDPDTERDEILRRAMAYLAKKDVPYVPLDVEEDIELSYAEDDLETFRENVKGWIKALAKSGRGAA